MKITYIFSLFLCTALFSGCMDDKKKETPQVKTAPTAEVTEVYTSGTIDATFEESTLTEVFSNYIELKTALVNTNTEMSKTAASNLMAAFANVGVDENTISATQKISESDDIKLQRVQFVDVTIAVEALLVDAIQEGVVYKQYCPMAFNNTGAYWLSESKEIRNPYFGDKMLKCGRIDAEIK